MPLDPYYITRVNEYLQLPEPIMSDDIKRTPFSASMADELSIEKTDLLIMN